MTTAAAAAALCSWRLRRRLRRDGLWDIGRTHTGPVELVAYDGTALRHAARSTSRRRLGRALDLVVASAATATASPLIALVAIAVKLDDGGPVLFVQDRIGRGGQPFRMHKFRTMAVDAELHPLDLRDERGASLGPLFNIADDPRVTRVGRFLRRSGLDELAQLIDVIAGEMRLVGPRPALPSEVVEFDDELRLRELVPPGVTGLWQVLAHDNPSLDVYRRLDLHYVAHGSIADDIAILAWTIAHLVGRWTSRRPPGSPWPVSATAQNNDGWSSCPGR